MQKIVLGSLIALLFGCAKAAPLPAGPGALATCRSWSQRGDTDILRATCGDTDVTVFRESEPWSPNIERIMFPQIVALYREHEGLRITPSRVAVGGRYQDALDIYTTEDGHPTYSRVTLFRDPQSAQTLAAWCVLYDQPLNQDCDTVINQLGTASDLAAVHASLPVDPRSTERDRRRSLEACTPTQRIDTTAYGTLERVTQLACDERTLFVGEEAGTLNDETRQMAFDRFREAFGAINSWNATFDLNGVEHRGVHAERSEPDGTRMEGFVMLLPSTRDKHRVFVCIMPGDMEECSPLLEQLAVMPGVGGMFGATQAPAAPPTPEAAPAPAPAPAEAPPPARRRRQQP